MTPRDALFFLALAWNSLAKPCSESEVTQAADAIITRLESSQIDQSNAKWFDLLDILSEFRDVDIDLFYGMLLRINQRANLKFLGFLAHYVYAGYLQDAEMDHPASVAEYQKAKAFIFDEGSAQYYWGNIGLAYIGAGDPGQAIACLKKSIDLAYSAQDLHSLGMYYQNLGVAYRSQGDLEETRNYYLKALQVSRELDDEYLATREQNLRMVDFDIEMAGTGKKPGFVIDHDPEGLGYAKGASLIRPLKVFLCHASEDKDAVREIFQAIRSRDIDPWLDEEKLYAGDNWRTRIEEDIHSSDAVVICLSSSLLNKTTFVQEEVRLSLEAAGIGSSERQFILPVNLDGCELPPNLSQFHCVAWSGPADADRVIKALMRRAEHLGLTKAAHRPS